MKKIDISLWARRLDEEYKERERRRIEILKKPLNY